MPDRSRLRLVVLGVLVVSLVATLLGRLWYLQVLNAPELREAALNQQIHDIVTPAPRGEILDDTGKPFVDNKPALVVAVNRTALDRLGSDTKSTVLHRLARALGKPYELLNNETTPCTYEKVHTSDGVEVMSSPTPCNNGLAYQPVVVSELKPTLAAAKKALQIKERPEDYPGVTVDLTAVRHYPRPEGAYASSMLGYIQLIGPDQLASLPKDQRQVYQNAQVGVTGLEAEYEKYLRGTPGVKQVSVDHLGAVTGTVKETAPIPGDNLVTNIDAGTQAALERQLQDAITAARHSGFTADYAAGVVLNARTGGVVAMASSPTYPPNTFVPSVKARTYKKLQHQLGSPLVDKAFQSASPPGSTFKLISSSGLLHDGTMTTDGYYDCPTEYRGHHNFDGEAGLGAIPLRTALIVSCDTFFFQLADRDWSRDQQLIKQHKKPLEGVQNMAHAYGLGEQPGIDLPESEVATGHIADRHNTRLNWEQNKKDYCAGAERRPKGSYLQQIDAQNCKFGYIFFPGDQMNQDIGQGTVTVSPLQLAVAYAAVANGGTVFEPRIAKAIVSPTGKVIKRIKAPVRDHLPLTNGQLAYLRDALYGVTTSRDPVGTAVGTFAGFPMNRVLVGGKTGTAELSGTQQNGCWFASFGGPAGEKPQFVTVVEVNKADQGAISAAPYVRNMWDKLYGFRGNKALFPNGVPPKKLPKIRIVEAGPPLRHHKAHRAGEAA
ncbi:MAG TPA: penicillin-binding transpeptidase domain-containing protein [Mycobacteriales bacterium]|nr:penicillin-binding transpeptidase domain-containing protein [Mycobacteriales bacterium]